MINLLIDSCTNFFHQVIHTGNNGLGAKLVLLPGQRVSLLHLTSMHCCHTRPTSPPNPSSIDAKSLVRFTGVFGSAWFPSVPAQSSFSVPASWCATGSSHDCGFHMLMHAQHWDGRTLEYFQPTDIMNICKILLHKWVTLKDNQTKDWKEKLDLA